MRIATYEDGGEWRAAIAAAGRYVDAERAAAAAGLPEPQKLQSTKELLGLSSEQRAQLLAAAEEQAGDDGMDRSALRLGPPVPDADKVICVGLNYREHAAEAEMAVPEFPVLFGKYRNALIGDEAPLALTDISEAWDYEAELAVVIGRRAKAVAEADALDHVGGYMPLNDISIRDVQLRISQWMTGKMIDDSAPCGPELVLTDEVPDPQALTLRLRLNGEVLQESSTAEMIFPVARLIAYISTYVTLEPGDIIATGTPAGVGFKRDPVVRLEPGDLIETEIEELGVLRTPCVGGAGAPSTSDGLGACA
jgi:2-keto-4-pentenoate hydratase/2-oxohepta-3-ene-1,7-dioic acid hydratase in catechol pathway